MPNTRGFDDMQSLLRGVGGLAESTGMPQAKFPNYLESYRKKMGVGQPFPVMPEMNTDPSRAVGTINTPMTRKLRKLWGR